MPLGAARLAYLAKTQAAGVQRDAVPLTVFGNTQIDTAESQFGGASALFDGSGDYLQSASLSEMAFGLEDFTFEAFINTDSTNSQIIISGRFGTGGSAAENNNVLAIVGGKLSWSNGSAWAIQDSVDISTNTWIHVACTRTNEVMEVFKDGVSIGTFNYSVIINNARPITIGAFNTGAVTFDGHIDEVRISSISRYSGNFTPPSSAFQNDADTIALYHMNGSDGSTDFPDDNG